MSNRCPHIDATTYYLPSVPPRDPVTNCIPSVSHRDPITYCLPSAPPRDPTTYCLPSAPIENLPPIVFPVPPTGALPPTITLLIPHSVYATYFFPSVTYRASATHHLSIAPCTEPLPLNVSPLSLAVLLLPIISPLGPHEPMLICLCHFVFPTKLRPNTELLCPLLSPTLALCVLPPPGKTC